MKKTYCTVVSIALVLVLALCLVACGAEEEQTSPWENATYRENTEFGTGAKTLNVEVCVEEQAVVFTIKTDAATVGEALMEYGLIDGEEGPYGLYVKVVNGITADYDIDQSWWAFYIDGGQAMTGVELTEIVEGAAYQLVYTK